MQRIQNKMSNTRQRNYENSREFDKKPGTDKSFVNKPLIQRTIESISFYYSNIQLHIDNNSKHKIIQDDII